MVYMLDASFSRSLVEKIATFQHAAVLIVGDIMLDEYLLGDTERISPEAPVPVVLVEKENSFVGGAGNVARNICALGGRAFLAGLVGDDLAGGVIQQCLDAEGVDSYLIRDARYKTTVKTRVLARRQQVVRIDREQKERIPQAVISTLLHQIEGLISQVSVIILSDYGKGVVCESLLTGLIQLNKNFNVPILLDPKPHTIHYYGAALMTPNAKEASELAGSAVRTKGEIMRAGRIIMEKFGCQSLIITLGGDGMAVFAQNDSVWHISTAAKHVFDVTGAGDTVIGVTGLGLASGLSLLEASIIANYAAGFVVGEVGAVAITSQQLAEIVGNSSFTSPEQWN